MRSTLPTILLAITTLTTACSLVSQGPGPIQTNAKKCKPQGPGSWTFAMTINMVAVPSPGRDPRSGIVSKEWFSIYDHTCQLQAEYTPCDGKPYVAKESFLPQVLTVTDVSFDLGNPYFSFKYGDGKYSIRNNGCVCQRTGSGIQGEKSCRCAFPLSGKSKRGLEVDEEESAEFGA